MAYPTTDEDEEQRILEEYLAMNQPALDELGGGAAPARQLGVEALPSPAPQQAEEDPLETFVKMSESEGRPQTPWSSYDAPPQYKEKDNTMLWLAMGLDAVLNQGESVPQYLAQAAQPDTSAQKNWELRNKAMNDASARAAREASAGNAALQARRLEQAERRIAMQERGLGNAEQREGRLAEKHDIELNPNNPMAQRVRENLYAQGVQPGSLDGLSLEAMKSSNNTALKNLVEQAQSTEMAAVAAEKSAAQARATEGSKIRVAEGTARVTHPYKQDLAREAAGLRSDDKLEAAAIEEEKTIGAERRKRAVPQEKEKATLQSVLDRLRMRDPGESLPAQGHFIERGIVKLKAQVGGGTGMNEEDSRLDNDLTTAGLQAYISDANNAPNSEREQDNAARKFRGDGTVAGAIAAIEAHLAKTEAAEQALRDREESGRMHRRKPRAEPGQPAVTKGRELTQDEWDELQDLGGDF